MSHLKPSPWNIKKTRICVSLNEPVCMLCIVSLCVSVPLYSILHMPPLWLMLVSHVLWKPLLPQRSDRSITHVWAECNISRVNKLAKFIYSFLSVSPRDLCARGKTSHVSAVHLGGEEKLYNWWCWNSLLVISGSTSGISLALKTNLHVSIMDEFQSHFSGKHQIKVFWFWSSEVKVLF